MRHGTLSMYNRGGCRCESCKGAKAAQAAEPYDVVRHLTNDDRKAIAAALQEICPEGLTDDCPARRAHRRTAV